MRNPIGKYTYKKNRLRDIKRKEKSHAVRAAACMALVLFLALFTGGCTTQIDAGRTADGASSVDEGSNSGETAVEVGRSAQEEDAGQPAAGGRLQIHFLDVGQGDCTLITCEDSAMLIDAGNNDRGTQIQNYLQKQGIKRLDYVIGTHPDADHIGGLDVILYKFDCGMILLPDYAKDTKTYEEVVQTMKAKNRKRTKPAAGDRYRLGGAEFTILNPAADADYGDNANDYSIGIRLVYGKNAFLFTGDAEEAAEAAMLKSGLSLRADVYKASHHGSRTASTKAFLKKVGPSYAVISCGTDNSYGHPHAEVLNRFRRMGIQVFRTDEQGTILLTSDGNRITWNCSPDVSWKAGEPGKAENGHSTSVAKEGKNASKKAVGAGKTGYVLNVNTKKYHLPSCSSVDTIAPKNRRDEKTTAAALEAEGYTACKRCIP